jgi:hypothetical protein
MKQILDLMMPMMKKMMKTAFDDMCLNKAAYACVATNANICLSEGGTVNPLGGDSLGLTSQFKNSLDCMCDVCSGARDAMIEFTSSIMSTLVNAFASIGNPGESSSEEQLQKDLLQGMCPLVGVNQCFQANPTVCAAALSDAMGSSTGTLAGMTFSTMDALEAQCLNHSVSTVVTSDAAPVTTQITLTGLDFAKVDVNATLKAAIIEKVKNQFATKLKYPQDRFTVTLSSGSVKATVSVQPVPGAPSAALQTTMSAEKDVIASGVLSDVKTIPNIDTGLKDGVTTDSIAATIDDPTTAASPTGQAQVASGEAAHLGLITIVAGLLSQVMG